jgi:glycosyltransferase involved in cell wall biosynthesis
VFGENRLPGISIIMAVYQGENYLHKCINSVLDQEFVDFEFIIIDDASTDATPSVIKSYNDPRIIYIRNNTNIGQTRSLNIGLEHAKTPLIARIDADDSWHPSKLELQIKFLEMHEEIAVLGTFANRLNTKGLVTGRRTYPLTESDIKTTLLRTVPVCHVSVVMRKQAILDVGCYPERYRTVADYALWSALVNAGYRITNLPEYLTTYMEDMGTFGAKSFVERESWEGAEIMQLNAQNFSGIRLDLDECRNILVSLFPEAGLTSSTICDAYINSIRLHGAIETGLPARFQVWKVLVAGLLKKWRFDRTNVADLLEDIGTLVCRYKRIDVMLALIMSAILLRLGYPHLKQIRNFS